ncbi:MAG: ATP-binding protein [Candidatus Omnitrophica bacterium]|nr:ATP-binding protein [Candidatus Omnitrophota bacterium]
MSIKTIADERILSRLDLVSKFVDVLILKMETLRLDEEIVFGIKLCLHEAVVNAVRHGNKEKHDLSVRVVIKTEGKKITLDVTDQGRGFDFSQIPNPTTEENIGRFHGRGIYLMKSMMDRVTFLNEGRTVRMTKVLKGGR